MSRFCENCAVELGNRGDSKSFSFSALIKNQRGVKIVEALNEVFYRRKSSYAPTEEDRLKDCRRSLCYQCAKALGHLHQHFKKFKNRSVEGSYCMDHYINAILNVTGTRPEPEMVDTAVQTKWTWTQKKLLAAAEAKKSGAEPEAKKSKNIPPSGGQPGQCLLVYGNDKQLVSESENSGSKVKKKSWSLQNKGRGYNSTCRPMKRQYVKRQAQKSNASVAQRDNDNIPSNENDHEDSGRSVIRLDPDEHNYNSTNQDVPFRDPVSAPNYRSDCGDTDESEPIAMYDNPEVEHNDEEQIGSSHISVESLTFTAILPSRLPARGQEFNLPPSQLKDQAKAKANVRKGIKRNLRKEAPGLRVIWPSYVPREILCPICSYDVKFPNNLKPHLLARHRPRIRTVKPRKERTCEECGKVFRMNKYYLKHESEKEKYGSCNYRGHACDYPKCKRTYRTQLGLKVHRAKHDNPPPRNIVCPHPPCDKRFGTRWEMKKHALFHTNRAKCVCEHCGKVLSSYASLYKHVRQVHRNPRKITVNELINAKRVDDGELEAIRPFKCLQDGCGQTFLLRQYLLRHMRHNHKHAFEFPCEQCPGISYTSSKGLQAHMFRTHKVRFPKRPRRVSTKKKLGSESTARKEDAEALEAVRPFKCFQDGCGQTFLVRQYLLRHMRNHHKHAFEFPCEHCPGISYNSSKGLKAHMFRTHKIGFFPKRPRRVSAKKKLGSESTARKEDAEALKAVRPFKCLNDGCGQTFLLRQYLLRHMRNHHKHAFEFPCEQCPGISYNSSTGLKMHMFKTHKVWVFPKKKHRSRSAKKKLGSESVARVEGAEVLVDLVQD